MIPAETEDTTEVIPAEEETLLSMRLNCPTIGEAVNSNEALNPIGKDAISYYVEDATPRLQKKAHNQDIEAIRWPWQFPSRKERRANIRHMKNQMTNSVTCWSCKKPSEDAAHKLLSEIGMGGCRSFLTR